MAQAQSGHTVKVHYRGTLDSGAEFDSSADREPLVVTLGSGQVIPGFEHALIGMSTGETKTVKVASDDAYGPHRSELVQDVERSSIPPSIALETGTVLTATDQNGDSLRLTVVELDEETVRLDANHPLAGEDLTFELELVEIA
jgi:peptidylprolyl isomerase